MTLTILRASRSSNRTSRGLVDLIGASIDDVKAKQINAPLCAGAAWPPGLGHNLHRVEASMHLTRASSYAISALVYMAKQKGNPPVASHTVAKATHSPERFLLKVLKPLASRGVLRSLRGPHGGYQLAKPAQEISILEVVEAVE